MLHAALRPGHARSTNLRLCKMAIGAIFIVSD
jgi:hypothetical protein